MKLIFALFFILISFYTNTFSQQFIVNGQIKDEKAKSPIAFATIIVFNEKDSALSMSISDERGFFQIPLERGKYSLLLRHIGFTADTINLTVDRDQYIGIIYLSPKIEEIEGVQVKANQRKVLLDRQEVIITKQMRGRATDLKSLLNQVNGITYEYYESKFMVDGHSNILFLVNGLEKDFNYVLSIDPERILKLQIIRNPSGRYGLEGYYAVINIILKDNFQGFDINLSGMAIWDLDGQKGSRDIAQRNNANFILTKNKWNIYFNQNYNNNKFILPNKQQERLYDNGLRIIRESELNNIFSSILNLTTGVDYQINPINVLSLEFNYSVIPFSRYLENYPSRVSTFLNSTLITSFDEENISKFGSKTYTTKLFYRGTFSNLDLKADLNYNKFFLQRQQQILQNNNYLLNNLSDNQEDELNFNLESNYYKGQFSINSGLGYFMRSLSFQTVNYGGQFADDFTSGLVTDYKLRAFLYFSWKLNKILSMKIGSASEKYFFNSKQISYNKWIFQPFANVQFRLLNNMLIMTFKYRAKTTYPTAEQLNPAIIVLDSGIVQQGNSQLKPSLVNTISFNVQVLNGLFSLEPYYKFSNNYIAQIAKESDNSLYDIIFIYSNIGKYQEKGVRINFILPFSSKIIWKNNVDLFTADMKYQILNNEFITDIKDWRGSSNLVYYNPEKITFGFIYQRYLSKKIQPNGYLSYGNDFLGFFLEKAFFKKKLTINTFYVFPIKENKFINYLLVNYQHTTLYEQYDYLDLSLLKNIFMIKLIYRFSKGKILKIEKPEEYSKKMKLKSLF